MSHHLDVMCSSEEISSARTFSITHGACVIYGKCCKSVAVEFLAAITINNTILWDKRRIVWHRFVEDRRNVYLYLQGHCSFLLGLILIPYFHTHLQHRHILENYNINICVILLPKDEAKGM